MNFLRKSFLFFILSTFLPLLFLSCSADGSLSDDLLNDTSVVYTFYEANPDENDNPAFVEFKYPIGKVIVAEEMPSILEEKIFAFKPGYEFAGWSYYSDEEDSSKKNYIEVDEASSLVKSIRVSADNEKFYVKDWTPVKYYVVLEGNGGYLADGKTFMDKIEFTYDEAQALPANSFVNKNDIIEYTFNGWAFSQDQDPRSPNYRDEEKAANLSNRKNATVTLYALWLREKINITYNENTGQGSMEPQVMRVSELPDKLTKNAYSKEGYYFTGWNTSIRGKLESYSDEASITRDNYPDTDITLYAQWQIYNYNVNYRFDSNNIYSSERVDWNNTATKPQAPGRKGYDFLGWYTSEDDGVTLSESAYDFSTPVTGDLELYAKWEMQTLTIKYDPNSTTATGSMDDLVIPYSEIEENNEVYVGNCSYDRTSEGYMFYYWTLSADSQGYNVWQVTADNWDYLRNNASGSVTLTVYAYWDILKYFVVFHMKGGTMEGIENDFGTYVECNSPVENPGTPVLTGYDFKGWYTSEDWGTTLADSAYDFSTPVTGELYLYAKWEVQSLTVKFNGNSSQSSGSMEDMNITYASLPVSLSTNEYVFTGDGYNYAGWARTSSAEACDYPDEFEINTDNWSSVRAYRDSSNILNLYCVWEIKKFTVSFVDALNLMEISSQNVEWHGSIVTPENPEKNHYSFLGWDLENNDWKSMESAANLAMIVDEDIVIYAKWTPDTYTLTFDGNGANEGELPTVTAAYGFALTIPSSNFRKNGYLFAGWAKSSTATSPEYAKNGTIFLNSDTTLYAVWTQRGNVSGQNKLSVILDEENEQIIFTASQNYDSYSWSINGTSIATGESLTVSYADYADGKNYFVLLIGYETASDEYSAESANFRILPNN
ncbi:MAG: InlB B-repeat-containing protein [Treponema sp.]|nr:InlB B-repeat-containing protein [Treponema sp.]